MNRHHRLAWAVCLTPLAVLSGVLAATHPTGAAFAVGVAAAGVLLANQLRHLRSGSGVEALGLGLISIGIFTVSWNGMRAPGALGHIGDVSDMFLLLGSPLILLGWLASKDIQAFPREPWYYLGGSLLVIGGLLGEMESGGGSRGLAFAIISVMILPLVIALGKRPRLIASAFVAGTTVNALVADSDRWRHTHYGYRETDIIIGRVAGLSFHPNHLGVCCAMAVALALGLAAKQRWWLIPVPLLILGAVATSSRGALALVPVAALFVLLVDRGFRQRYLATVVLGFAILATVAYATGKTTPQAFGYNRQNVYISDQNRLQGLAQAWSDFTNHPLTGNGYTVINEGAENAYLEFAQGGGILAVTGIALVICSSFLTAVRLRRDPLAAATAAAVLVVAGNMLVQNQATSRHLYVPVGLALALSFITQRAEVGELAVSAPSGVPPALRVG